eukprot:TRINITY_DN18674_c0_g1_i1.p1 TRINITY_DN18674_c0_g1~~TRINITY_DN18674_c0_g1_i1.p1  ORF type:complete len:2410 (-),score=547.03 TRINITY_DN18674_c0_g1_i1:144-7373(-)
MEDAETLVTSESRAAMICRHDESSPGCSAMRLLRQPVAALRRQITLPRCRTAIRRIASAVPPRFRPRRWPRWLLGCYVFCCCVLSGRRTTALAASAAEETRQLLEEFGGDEKPELADEEEAASADEEERRLQVTRPDYVPFTQKPYVNVIVFDSHDAENCNRNYASPPIDRRDENGQWPAGYPRDGTDVFRKRDMSCGIAPARFVFYTSDLPAYTDTTIEAKMQVQIICKIASFIEADTCESVLDTTGNTHDGFPMVESCRFIGNKASLLLRTRLSPNSEYSVTLKLVHPKGRHTAADNSFDMQIWYYQMSVIEGTLAPIDIIHTVPHAKVEDAAEGGYGNDYEDRGYLTAFTWIPLTQTEYKPLPSIAPTWFQFGIRTFGRMAQLRYGLDVVAYPTNVWKFGQDGEACQWSAPGGRTTDDCKLKTFAGAGGTIANGFRIIFGTAVINLGADTSFKILLQPPDVAVNAYWTATSFYKQPGSDLLVQPFTVMLDKPIYVQGKAQGSVANWELAALNTEQWVTLEFTPGNTLVPDKDYSGFLVIVPPLNFTVVESSAPQDPSLSDNRLPCQSWPLQDRQLGRWRCPLGDQAVYKDTRYKVRLKVINPSISGAAQSWRMELWQKTNSRPISVTRNFVGMPIAGTMKASIAQDNQLIGAMNRLRVDFLPSQDAGTEPDTSLQVVAPEGFLIVKSCRGFEQTQVPESYCEGSDSNFFRIIFPNPDSIKANNPYIFHISVKNPDFNVAEEDNYWKFDTMRPDRIAVDTARFPGFFLYPSQFQAFRVAPVSRKTGPQFVIVRFISKVRIPSDDYIRIRAPTPVHWHAADLGYDTSNFATDAYSFTTRDPTVIFATPNVMLSQLTSVCDANFEYGIRARVVVPQNTPIPNRWWIEHFRQTGQPPPNNWLYKASKGAEGYPSQVLINVRVDPMNIVKQAWQNPTLITFEGTVNILPTTKTTALGMVPVEPEFYIEAPPGFTYICPLTVTDYYPPFTVPVPDNVRCEVNHNDQANRNKLHLYFPDGIKKETRYGFTIDLVNAKYDDPVTNFFRLETRLDGATIEDAVVQGKKLADGMDNTRLVIAQDRRVNIKNDIVTFIIGTIRALPYETTLEVKAPRTYKFQYDCKDEVGRAQWVPKTGPATGTVAEHDFPAVQVCQNLQTVNAEWTYIASIGLACCWGLGNHALQVSVENPRITPRGMSSNFWGFTIYDRTVDKTPEMSESHVYGFLIQEIRDARLKSYNSGNGVLGEAAINRVDIEFMLTTQLPPEGVIEEPMIVLRAPEGFRFPTVCRHFYPDTKRAGLSPLPELTECQGNNGRELTLTLPLFRTLNAMVKYAFRFLVINPSETFDNGDTPEKWWRLETKRQSGDMVDLNEQIPSFPIMQRLRYFVVDTLSRVGMNTTIFRFHYKTDDALPPQQTIHITPPLGTKFYGLRDGICSDQDPMALARLFADVGKKPLISGVTRLPEWMSCTVVSPTEIRLTNTESILGGRPLVAGPVFEFFVENVTNAQTTPDLNIFQIAAHTMTPLGKEVWIADGWVIFPELGQTRVMTSNPGYGLYTRFTFRMYILTEVPEKGTISVEAPPDYYFGPMLTTEETEYNPRVSLPPPQGENDLRPPPDQWHECDVLREWTVRCPFDFRSCRVYADLKELQDLGVNLPAYEVSTMLFNKGECDKLRLKCAAPPSTSTTTTMLSQAGTHRLSDVVKCRSRGTRLELQIENTVVLPADTLFEFSVMGYNARTEHVMSAEDDTWYFVTQAADGEKTILDEKDHIPGLTLMGVVFVPSITPADTRVNTIVNYVTIRIILTTPCPPRAKLKITYPMNFRRNQNAAFTGSAVSTGNNFPRQVQKITKLNYVELIAIEEAIPAGIPLDITIGLSNPSITPHREDNIWEIEASTLMNGYEEILNCNYMVDGFKIFGEFAKTAVTGTVFSPTANSLISPWFILKSPLDRGSGNEFKVWLPPGYIPVTGPSGDCGGEAHRRRRGGASYNNEYINQDGKAPHPPEIEYLGMPPGSECYPGVEDSHHYVSIKIDDVREVDYGVDYAFQFLVVNPRFAPAPEANIWRFETLKHGVILHLQEGIAGFELEQIKVVEVTPDDTTTLLPLNKLTFYMMSDKYIPGGSTITIRAPKGFIFTCKFFRTDAGLASTTTCFRNLKSPHIVTFTIDSQDPKQPETPFRLFVFVSNPEFTPQDNQFGFDIVSPLGQFIDIRDYVSSFDITGTVRASVFASSPYLGESNRLLIEFEQSTILNQADNGNEIVVTAPIGYVFRQNCTGFFLRLFNPKDIESEDEDGYPATFTFPPPGIKCMGFDNRTVVVRLPDGKGLLRSKYVLEVDVENPGYTPNTSNIWEFITRVRNDHVGERIVDANRTLAGFVLQELVPLKTDEDAASSRLTLLTQLLGIMAPLFVLFVASAAAAPAS